MLGAKADRVNSLKAGERSRINRRFGACYAYARCGPATPNTAAYGAVVFRVRDEDAARRGRSANQWDDPCYNALSPNLSTFVDLPFAQT